MTLQYDMENGMKKAAYFQDEDHIYKLVEAEFMCCMWAWCERGVSLEIVDSVAVLISWVAQWPTITHPSYINT